MTYQPLALKYRPQNFDDVVGQEVVTTTLRHALEQGRISHAYLFSGMRGVGKTTMARILAKCLNCRSFDAPTVEPCDECESCTEIAASRSIDVLEIDGASNTSVDDVRALQENLIYSPARDRYKVYIVDEVHMLSRSAFNAFLKTLEEPPPRVVFIFATTEQHKIPATVMSRCLSFDFGRVSAGAIAERLRMISGKEKVKVEESAIDLIVFQSEGSIRDAISAFDQVINFSGGNITYDDALKTLGMIDREVLHRLVNAVVDQNAQGAFEVIREAASTGGDMRLFCRQLIRHIRDLLISRVGDESGDLLPYNDKEIELLREQANRVSEEDLSRFFDILVRADEEMQMAATPQYYLEAAAVKMIHSTRLMPLTELIASVESGGLARQEAFTAPMPREPELNFSDPQEKEPAIDPNASDRDRLLTAARGSSVVQFLKSADEIRREGDTLHLSFASQTVVNLLSSGELRQALAEAVKQAFAEGVSIDVRFSGSTQSDSVSSPEPRGPAGTTESLPPVEEDEAPPLPGKTSVRTEGNDSSGGVPEDIKRKVRNDPLAGPLVQELELTFDRVNKTEPKEEEK